MDTSETSPTSESEEIATLKALNAAQAARIAILEEQLRLAAVKSFAPKSEKLSALAQMDLFNEAEALARADAPETNVTEITVPAHARARGKRKPIDGKLPRVRVEHDMPEEQKTCRCGCQLTRIGEVTSEQFDLVPARAQVLQHVRFKYACRSCEGTSHDGPAVITATMPAQPIPKSNASPGLLAHVACAKFVDGLPLYRQVGILARYSISVSRTALAFWMIRLGDLVMPLINLMHETQLSYDVLQMDETSVQVLKEDGRPATAKSFMWVGEADLQDNASSCSTMHRPGPAPSRCDFSTSTRDICSRTPTRATTRLPGAMASSMWAASTMPGESSSRP